MSTTTDSFDPVQFDRLATLSVPGYSALQDLVALAASHSLPQDARILDVGCGTGSGLPPLAKVCPKATLVACDPVPAMLEAARERCANASVQVQFVHGSIDAVSDEKPFDVIVSTLVLHFVPGPLRAIWLRALRARLRPEGKLILTTLVNDEQANAVWADLRKQYVLQQGLPLAELARRQAQSTMVPVVESELREHLTAAGFAAPVALYQLLAVKCWLVKSPPHGDSHE